MVGVNNFSRHSCRAISAQIPPVFSCSPAIKGKSFAASTTVLRRPTSLVSDTSIYLFIYYLWQQACNWRLFVDYIYSINSKYNLFISSEKSWRWWKNEIGLISENVRSCPVSDKPDELICYRNRPLKRSRACNVTSLAMNVITPPHNV